MIYYKLINNKNFFKAIITSFFLVIFSIDTSFASSLNKIRLSYDEQASKLRIVFDANKKINYVINKSPDNLIKISFKDIKISDNFQKHKIENPDIQTFKLAKNKNNVDVTFKSKKSFKYKYFSLDPDGKYGHRYVLDVVMGKLVNNNKIDKNL